MKTTILLFALIAATFIGSCQRVKAQTNTNTGVQLPITINGALNIFTNLPDTTPDLATIGISAGAVTLRAAPENYVKIDYDFGHATNFWTKFKIGGEIYNDPNGVGIDSAALYLGWRAMVTSENELAFEGFGRRSWATVNDGLITPSFSGGAQITYDWRILSGNNLYTEAATGIESPDHGGGAWGKYIKAGIKYNF